MSEMESVLSCLDFAAAKTKSGPDFAPSNIIDTAQDRYIADFILNQQSNYSLDVGEGRESHQIIHTRNDIC